MCFQSFAERLQGVWYRLQTAVNVFMDSEIDKRLAKDSPNGIRQVCVFCVGVLVSSFTAGPSLRYWRKRRVCFANT